LYRISKVLYMLWACFLGPYCPRSEASPSSLHTVETVARGGRNDVGDNAQVSSALPVLAFISF
jgi:hypothetical protein